MTSTDGRDEDATLRPIETIKLRGAAFTTKVRDLIHEGNVRRIVIKNDEGHIVMEIPVTAGVVALAVAPVITAVGAIAALANDWTVEVHRTSS